MKEKYIVTEAKELDNTGFGVYADQDIPEGELVINLLKDCTWRNAPTRTSIQLGEKHMESAIGGFVNHHCEPNARVLLAIMSFDGKVNLIPPYVMVKGTISSIIFASPTPWIVSTRFIEKGEQIFIDYNETEHKLANPFECSCHGRLIKGKYEMQTMEDENGKSRT